MSLATPADMAAINAAMAKSSLLPPWARGHTASPVFFEFYRLFPKTNFFHGFMEATDEEFEAMNVRDQEQDARLETLVRGLHAAIEGDSSYRIPRCLTLQHANRYRLGLILMNPFAADSQYLNLATQLMIHNLRSQAAGAFDRDEDHAEAEVQED